MREREKKSFFAIKYWFDKRKGDSPRERVKEREKRGRERDIER